MYYFDDEFKSNAVAFFLSIESKCDIRGRHTSVSYMQMQNIK